MGNVSRLFWVLVAAEAGVDSRFPLSKVHQTIKLGTNKVLYICLAVQLFLRTHHLVPLYPIGHNRCLLVFLNPIYYISPLPICTSSVKLYR